MIVYIVKNIKFNQNSATSNGSVISSYTQETVSKLIAGGVYDIGTNLSSFMQLSPEKRHIQTSMNLLYVFKLIN